MYKYLKHYLKYVSVMILLFIYSCGTVSEKTTINIWHQMLYENRKALRDMCDIYELDHPDVQINLLYRETEELRSTSPSSAMAASLPELISAPCALYDSRPPSYAIY